MRSIHTLLCLLILPALLCACAQTEVPPITDVLTSPMPETVSPAPSLTPPETSALPETTAAPETTTAPASSSSISSPLLTLVMRYAQKFEVETHGDNYTIKGDTSIKYRRGGTITIIPDAGYEIVDVVADGKSLGAVTEVTFKKVTKSPELFVITREIGKAN